MFCDGLGGSKFTLILCDIMFTAWNVRNNILFEGRKDLLMTISKLEQVVEDFSKVVLETETIKHFVSDNLYGLWLPSIGSLLILMFLLGLKLI